MDITLMRFYRLLDQLIEHPEKESEIEAKIRLNYEGYWSVWVSDMSGFSSRTSKYGILHFLGLIRRQHRQCLPFFDKYSAIPIKFEADNMLVLFNDTQNAVNCAVETIRHLQHYNKSVHERYTIRLCIGIGFGPVLNLDNRDVFGNEVNLASKLGEDVADAEQVLITEAAFEQVKEMPGVTFEKRSADVSNVKFDYYRVVVE